MIKVNYYDGPITLNDDRTLEEIEEAIKKADEESEKLTEWPPID